MVQVKDLTDLTLEDLWREVKWQSEDWWEEIEKRQLRAVKMILESSLEEELLAQLQASRYKRTESRRSYRNGHYERSFSTKYGVIKALRCPGPGRATPLRFYHVTDAGRSRWTR